MNVDVCRMVAQHLVRHPSIVPFALSCQTAMQAAQEELAEVVDVPGIPVARQSALVRTRALTPHSSLLETLWVLRECRGEVCDDPQPLPQSSHMLAAWAHHLVRPLRAQMRYKLPAARMLGENDWESLRACADAGMPVCSSDVKPLARHARWLLGHMSSPELRDLLGALYVPRWSTAWAGLLMATGRAQLLRDYLALSQGLAVDAAALYKSAFWARDPGMLEVLRAHVRVPGRMLRRVMDRVAPELHVDDPDEELVVALGTAGWPTPVVVRTDRFYQFYRRRSYRRCTLHGTAEAAATYLCKIRAARASQ